MLDENRAVFVEDAGDTLHTQRNALDSPWMFDRRKNCADPANQPLRLGRGAHRARLSGSQSLGRALSSQDPLCDTHSGILASAAATTRRGV